MANNLCRLLQPCLPAGYSQDIRLHSPDKLINVYSYFKVILSLFMFIIKAVPLLATKALAGRGVIVPTHL
jgi:hypothetical protein